MPPPRSPRTALFLKQLRRLHAWVGLAGAGFGLLFGLTGFLLNHRSVWKIEAARDDVRQAHLTLATLPATPEALRRDLATQLGYRESQGHLKTVKARKVNMGGANLQAGEVWDLHFRAHGRQAKVLYSPGSPVAQVEHKDANLLGLLNRLHKSDAASLPWILLMDAVALGTIFLTLSGVLLWTRLAGPRLLAAALALGGLALAFLLALPAL